MLILKKTAIGLQDIIKINIFVNLKKFNIMKEIFSSRLKMARLMRGLSMDELSVRMGNIISKQSISKYERGKIMPNSTTLLAISKALQLPIDYFFRENIPISPLNFRIDKHIPAHSSSQLAALAQDKIERYLIIEDLLSINYKFKNPLYRCKVETLEDVEKAGEMLRQKWSLGSYPIFSVYEMLESVGIKLLEFETGECHILGFSTLVNHNIPLIVVNLSANATIERKRFTALHELGHILLNFSKQLSEEECECFCHRFAAAVLCPASIFYNELGHRRNAFTLDELISLKIRYGISVSAIVHRAKDLGVITNSYYNQIFNQRIHQNLLEEGWGTYPFPEHTDRFDRLLHRAAAEHIISINRAAELANEDIVDFRANLDVI